MTQAAWFLAVAVPAVILLGLGKGGFAGTGALAVPILATAVSPVRAAAILLPIMVIQDVVGVWAFRRNWDGYVLGWMMPGAIIGITLAYFFAALVDTRAMLGVVGGISLLFGLYRLWLRGRSSPAGARQLPGWVGTLAGIASGFTSQIAHAGQPPFQLWVTPRGLKPEVLAGTTAIFFAVTNLLKLPAYWALGQFTQENLLASAALVPIAILSTFAGVWLVRRVSPQRFYTAIYALMVLVGIKLIWDAAA